MSDKPSFFAELKRRNVYKVAVAYAVVGWLLVQIATQVFPFFEIPNWTVRLIVLAIVIGLPIALAIAWAFELTPEGIRRTEAVDRATEKRGKSHAWIYVVAVGAVLSIGLFFLGRYSTGKNAVPRSASEEPRRDKQSETGSSIPQKSIAVLPFENLSDDKNTAYFAEGIQDEILTKLSGIADLKVISRTSTAKYKSKPEDLKTVSQQLGVATVLEGSVQKAGDKVRVNVQLIDARADSHLWAKSYDREIQDIFAVESEVAQEIADSLQAKLSPAEANTVASAPTKDAAAYDFFLKGEYQHRAALAHPLARIAELVVARDRVRFRMLALGMVNAILLLFANWLSLWDFRSIKAWDPRNHCRDPARRLNVLDLRVVRPKAHDEGPIDLEDFFGASGRISTVLSWPAPSCQCVLILIF